MKLDLKKNWIIFFYTFFITILFISPVLFFGIEDVENYGLTLFSSSIISKNYLNPFIFFTDNYGPGIEFPFGSGLSSHPLILFIENKKIFYFLFLSFHLLLSCLYFFKISKLYKINPNIYLAIPLLIFSNINFNHVYANDWATGVFIYNFIFVLFYQFLKILKKNSLKDFIKFSIFFYFYFENGHPGIALMVLMFFLIIFLFSNNKLEILKSYKPYLFFIILVFLLSEKIYFVSFVYFDLISPGVEVERVIQSNYVFSDFINSLWPFYSYYRVYDRLPPNPYLLIISLIFVIKFFNDKHHLDLKIAYLLNLLFAFSPLLIFLKALPGLWWFRYFIYIVACLIFFNYFNSLDKKKKIVCISILFLYIACVYAVNVRGISKAPNNFIKNKVEDFKLINFFKDLKLSNNFNRIYLSPEAFALINRRGESKYGIYHQTDLVNYNLIPFNGHFKNVTSTKFFTIKQTNLMYTDIDSNLNHLSNPLFLNIFNIKYSFVSSNDLKYLTKKNYKIIKSIFIKNQHYYIIQNNIKFLTINNVKELNQKIDQCKKAKIDCVLDNHNYFDLIDIKFKKIKNGYYEFLNTDQNPKVNLVLPFVYSNNWKCNNERCGNINNFLIYSKNFEKKLLLKYDDKIRYYLKILSLLNLVMLLIFLFYLDFFKSYLTNKKNNIF